MNDDPPPTTKAPALTPADRQRALVVARETLRSYLEDGSQFILGEESPALMDPRAAFVTVRERGTYELRGCRGEVHAHQPLIESIAEMAIAAATDDPRFSPIEKSELPNTIIQISALTEPFVIRPEQIELNRHGLILELGRRSGLLLPKVPKLYDITTPLEFLESLCRKAHLPQRAWTDPEARLLAFEAEEWGEGE